MSENRGERVFYQMEDGKLPVVVGQLRPTPRHLGAGLAVIRRRDSDITVPVDALKYADTGRPVQDAEFFASRAWRDSLPDDPMGVSAWEISTEDVA